ncbi:MAG: hypothetical protein ACE5KE_15540, partial [Methanosarcinales archaeon]
IQRIMNQVMNRERKECFYCGDKIHFKYDIPWNGHTCEYCGLLVCMKHRIDIVHGCTGKYKEGGVVTIFTGKGRLRPINLK